MLTLEAQRTSQILLDIGAVTFNLDNPYIYASGIKSPVYTDCRLIMRYPQQRNLIARLLCAQIMVVERFDVIAGTATAGIPHAAWVAERLEKPMAYVRSEAKSHGRQNQIEGIIYPGERVALVEDLISTGGSSIEAIKALREAGAQADYVFAIMAYGMAAATENFTQAQVRPIVLATFDDVVTMAIQQGRITEDQKQVVLDWVQDPSGWSPLLP